jgi:hypothetical protein
VKDSLNLVSPISLNWIQTPFQILTPLTIFVPNSTTVDKGGPIGTSGYSIWSSISSFESFSPPEAGGSNYEIVGKDTRGAEFKFVGVDTGLIPECVSDC